MSRSTFSENLHRLRLKQGLSQASLAQKASLTQAALSQMERGARLPALASLVRLSEALGGSPERLLQPPPGDSLPREEADRIARWIVDGRPLSSRRSRDLAAAVGSLVIQKLRAHHAPNRSRYAGARWSVGRRGWEVQRRYGARRVRQTLQRVDALLAMRSAA